MITNRTALIVSISKLKARVNALFIDLSELDVESQDTFKYKLIQDIGYIINLFEIDESKEFECICCYSLYVEVLNSIPGMALGIDSTTLASSWQNIAPTKKNNLLMKLFELKGHSDFLSSLNHIWAHHRTHTEHVIKFFEYYGELIVGADGHLSEEEKYHIGLLLTMIENSQGNVSERKVTYLNKLLESNHLQLKNDTIDLNPFSDLRRVVVDSQAELMQFDPKFIGNVVKVLSFLDKSSHEIEHTYRKFGDTNNTQFIDVLFEALFSQVKIYNYTFTLLAYYIESALNKDYFSCHETEGILEARGLFMSASEIQTIEVLKEISAGQNQIGSVLNLISKQLDEIYTGINQLNENLVSLTNQVRSLEQTMQSGFNQISEGLSKMTFAIAEGMSILANKLDSINSSVQMGNMISAVNAYQSYRINQKVSKLLK